MTSVRTILSAFHNAMPDVGYQQGMSYIVVILCLYLDEEVCSCNVEHNSSIH
jgi:hypothetical protein